MDEGGPKGVESPSALPSCDPYIDGIHLLAGRIVRTVNEWLIQRASNPGTQREGASVLTFPFLLLCNGQLD